MANAQLANVLNVLDRKGVVAAVSALQQLDGFEIVKMQAAVSFAALTRDMLANVRATQLLDVSIKVAFNGGTRYELAAVSSVYEIDAIALKAAKNKLAGAPVNTNVAAKAAEAAVRAAADADVYEAALFTVKAWAASAAVAAAESATALGENAAEAAHNAIHVAAQAAAQAQVGALRKILVKAGA